MRILVTGANGLVGSRLVKALASHEVTATGRGERRALGPGTYVAADLTDARATKALVEAVKPEVIVNCAAMTDVDGCERDRAQAWAANVDAVATLAQCDAHLVHVSTDYIFDGTAGPYDIDAIANPRGVYAQSKFAGELAVKSLSRSWAIARTAVVCGWPAAGKNNFGSWLISAFTAAHKPINLFDDQWVSPSLALNVAAMLAELAEKKLTGVFHTCGAEVVDRVTFGHALAKQFGFKTELIQPTHMRDVKLAIPRPVRSGLIATTSLDTKPMSLRSTLDHLFAEFQEKP